jgi:hypothetical protein
MGKTVWRNLMYDSKLLREKIEQAVLEAVGSNFKVRLGGKDSGFSSIGMSLDLRVEVLPLKIPDKKLKSCKAYFKSRGKSLGLLPKIYYKSQLKYEGRMFTWVGITDNQAILKYAKNEYYVIPHTVAKVAADHFAGKIGNHIK